MIWISGTHFIFQRWICAHVCVYVCAVVSSCLTHLLVFTALHLSSWAPCSCSNCYRSDCSPLDAMEAVIGHPRHSNQWLCYYQDFQAPRFQTGGPAKAKRGTRSGDEVRLRSLLWLHRDRPTACLGCLSTAQRPTCICSHHPARWHFLFTECFSSPHHVPNAASLMEPSSVCYSCCHTSPVKGSKGNPGITASLYFACRHFYAERLTGS